MTLWRTAANVFLKLAPLAAMAVDSMSSSREARVGSRLWGRLAEALSKFLLGPVAVTGKIGAQRNQKPGRRQTGVEGSGHPRWGRPSTTGSLDPRYPVPRRRQDRGRLQEVEENRKAVYEGIPRRGIAADGTRPRAVDGG